ncbi:MAG: energy transducer TonB, partial [Vicinamibacteria bacterium]
LWAIPLGIAAVAALALTAVRFGLFSSASHREPVRVSDLGAPRDVYPVLLSGGPANAPPGSNSGVHPTILYRIRIDREGNVYPQRPHESRKGLAAFEEAASEALASYRFSPAVREGVPVPIEMNWPVDFVWRKEPSATPLPVDEDYFTDPLLDRPPKLMQGESPETPLPQKRARPRIECRVLIDEQGNVTDAAVVEPRPGLEIYEQAAVDAVRSYRFEPAMREQQIVPAWVTLTVEFR